ncbi:hypothetical protein DP113_23215 [Brasilonema octagenarum UFV-E1]|uniref:17 kDa surface antigen n=1 Tax=Brasilonema sennae CENA114 TaxID=415709 RepID=A0A856MGT5_9CYAN|nr:hypothetical protein [Brasilonema sennae]QDL10433.1 hypothetical protein DP114_23310 [Brasilonema sennae CENA114]QDL16779.1 hypothetical protein DP113_23215 [Brasilonema octagenarum UFV-E1]
MSYNKHQYGKNADRIKEQRTAPQAGIGLGGGLVGAAIGGLLGRRVGGVSGAVVGAVAGALVGKGTAERVNRTVDSLVDAAKSVAETINHSVNGVGNAVKDTVEEAKTSVVGVVQVVKDTVEEAKPSLVSTLDSIKDTIEEAKPSVVGAVQAVKDTVEEAKPSVVGVVQAVKDTVEEAKPSVVGVVQAVKDTVEEAKPSVVSAAKNVAEAVNESINDVGTTSKNTVNEVKQSVEEVKPSGNNNNEIHQEPLVTEQLSKSSKQCPQVVEDVMSSSSNCPQYEEFIPPTVIFPASHPSTLPLAPERRGDFFMQELRVESQENSNLSDEINIEEVPQGLNDSQQPKSFEEIDIKDIKEIKYNNIQQEEKEFQHSQQETTQQLKQLTIQPEIEKNQNFPGIIVGVTIISLIGLTLGFIPKQNQLVIKSSASSQSLSPISETTSIRTAPTMTDGWIFVGNINKASDSVLVGKTLIKSSQPTNSPIIPSVGSIVAVAVEPGITLRDNKPQPPNFSHQQQKALAILKPQEKLKILKVEFVKSSSTTESPIKVWAKVRKCGSACLQQNSEIRSQK